MPRLRIQPIVEGHGDVIAVPILLRRIALELFDASYVDVLPPIRVPRSRILTTSDRRRDELARAAVLARLKLRQDADVGDRLLALVLIDADEDCPAQLGPTLEGRAASAAHDVEAACVMAKTEFETWLVAGAGSLGEYLDLPSNEALPGDPESHGIRKRWIQKRSRRGTYSETVDQPKLTARMDLREARSRSPSFDKLCREVGDRLIS